VPNPSAQLTQLKIDASAGVNSIFVSADSQLRRVLRADPDLHDMLGRMVSHLGLMAIVDVMVGLDADARSLARLIWAGRYDDNERALLDYFVGLALREYSDAVAMDMQDVARKLATEAARDATARQLDLFSADPEDVAVNAHFLDRYETEFFKNKAEALERQRVRSR
jgi:hypothetical protein